MWLAASRFRAPGDRATRQDSDWRDDVATWDAQEWLAGLVGCERGELAVRSIDRYGPRETQVRYERGAEVVARLIIEGPIVPMGVREGQGHWVVSVRISSGSDHVHTIDVAEPDEILYYRGDSTTGRLTRFRSWRAPELVDPGPAEGSGRANDRPS